MTQDYSTEAAAVANAMNAVYENKTANKKDDISGDFSSDTVSYPTVKAVKTELAKKISTSQTAGLVKNDGTIDTNTYLTSHQSLDSKTVTVEKATSNIGDNVARYTIKQGGTALTNGVIDIPRDFLVKSGEVKTCSTANSPVSGYLVGDKYLDFVINSKDGGANDTHMYVLVKDLVEDTTYSADGSTLQLSSGTFSIKASGVDTSQIKNGAVTSDKIASAVKNSWLSSSDVQSEISDFATALAAAINPSS